MKHPPMKQLAVGAAALLLGASAASAVTVSGTFSIFENSDNVDVSDYSFSYLFDDGDTDDGSFTLTVMNTSVINGGTVTASQPTVATILFDYGDGSTLTFTNAAISSTGVSFTLSTDNLPGGNNLIPSFSTNNGYEATPPPSQNGLDPGESLSMDFTYGSDLEDLKTRLISGDLRIGLHILEIGDDGESSVSAINNPPGPDDAPIPEPTSSTLFIIGASLVVILRRRY